MIMNAKRNSYLSLVLLLGMTLPVMAQFNNVGTSAANFLKIPVGARGTALGGAYVSMVNDATSLFWNVAGMSNVVGHEITFQTNYWLLDLRHNFLAGVFSISTYDRIGVSISYLSMGEMNQTTPAQPRGTGLKFSAYDVALGLAYARQLTDRIAVGIHTKYVREVISKSSASGVAFDVGLQYRSDWNNLRVGAAITNFGPDLRMEGEDLRVKLDPYPTTGSNPEDVPLFLETESFSLPIQFQFGVSITPYQSESLSLTTVLDVRDARDFNQEFRLGGELEVMKLFYVRGGANLFMVEGSLFGGSDQVVVEGQEEGGTGSVGSAYVNPTTITRGDLRDGQPLFNLGAGVRYTLPSSGMGLRFDYAFSRVRTLEDIHRFGLTLSF